MPPVVALSRPNSAFPPGSQFLPIHPRCAPTSSGGDARDCCLGARHGRRNAALRCRRRSLRLFGVFVPIPKLPLVSVDHPIAQRCGDGPRGTKFFVPCPVTPAGGSVLRARKPARRHWLPLRHYSHAGMLTRASHLTFPHPPLSMHRAGS